MWHHTYHWVGFSHMLVNFVPHRPYKNDNSCKYKLTNSFRKVTAKAHGLRNDMRMLSGFFTMNERSFPAKWNLI